MLKRIVKNFIGVTGYKGIKSLLLARKKTVRFNDRFVEELKYEEAEEFLTKYFKYEVGFFRDLNTVEHLLTVPFQVKGSSARTESLFTNNKNAIMVLIAKGAIEYQFNHNRDAWIRYERRIAPTHALLQQIASRNAQFKVKFLLNIDDNPNGLAPEVTFCSNKNAALLIPDPYFISTRSYSEFRKLVEHACDWSKRRRCFFWRGATSGRSEGSNDWRDLPRIRMCRMSAVIQSQSEIGVEMNCGISEVCHQPPGVENALKKLGLLKPVTVLTDLLEYRYHIDIDGNSNSWPGLFLKLLTGSPVLKIESPYGYCQWYYPDLEPFVNYVPVLSDLSDFEEKVIWLWENPVEAERIGKAGKLLAESLDFGAAVSQAQEVLLRASDELKRF